MSIMLQAENVVYNYPAPDGREVKALNKINLEVNKGEFIGIIGRNGSGKSTLAKLFNGLIIPTEGKILVKGMETSDQSKIWEIRQTAGMVFQNPDNQIVATVVEEDVAFGPENLGINPELIRQRVDNSLKVVDMYQFLKRAPHLLSGGQKQRIAIAGVLAMRPECIILDEPTAMLDPSGRKEVINTVRKLNKEEGITVVYITHYMDEVVYADRLIALDKGDKIMEGPPLEIFTQVDKLKEIGLDVPQMTELAYNLNKKGLDIPINVMTVDEMVMKLCQL